MQKHLRNLNRRNNLLDEEVSTKAEKVKYALEHNPLLLTSLLDDTSINRGMMMRLCKQFLPCRIGIEFELSGSLLPIVKEFGRLSTNKLNKLIKDIYKLTDYREDGFTDDPEKIHEIRISIHRWDQLASLYKLMELMKIHCKLHEGGGIHIHVDISKYNVNRELDHNYKKYLESRISEIESIFPKYLGKYNKRAIGIQLKGNYLNISRLNTLEFRIAPLTFEYSTLMKWVRDCIKLRNRMIHAIKPKSIISGSKGTHQFNFTIRTATPSGASTDYDNLINVNTLICNDMRSLSHPASNDYINIHNERVELFTSDA